MSDAEHTIVAGLLQRPTRIVDASGLDPDYFTDAEARALFRFTVTFHEKRGRKHGMDLALARNKLEQSKSKHAPPLLELVGEYDRFQPITDSEFAEALTEVVKARRETVLRSKGKEALEAMLEGNYEEAQAKMRAGLLEAQDADVEDDRPIDIRSPEGLDEERRNVDKDRSGDKRPGFDIGFPRMLRAVRFRRKELTILGGYAADGKTQFSKAICYNANQAGANVLFVALEMTRQEVRAMFLAQHAASIDARGLNWVDAMDGQLNASAKKLWKAALDDFEVDSHEDSDTITSRAGRLVIWAPRKTINQNDWLDRVRACKAEDEIDIAVKDYTELVKPAPKKGFPNYRLDLKEMIEQDKGLARECNIWVIDNHQISRKGRDDAEKRKPPHYLKRDLGESSGLERAADHVIWVYSDHDLKDDREARVGIAKARKGDEIVHGYHVYADYKKSLMAEVEHIA